MRIIEYGKAGKLAANDALLVDGGSGSRQLPVADAFFSMLESSGIPEVKKMYTRGANLGSVVTADQLAAIRNGSFTGMWLGDYWVVNNVTWRIVDFNYWFKHTNHLLNYTTNHAVIMPDTELGKAQMRADNLTSGGYVNSDMYRTGLNSAKTTISGVFGSSLITHKSLLVTKTGFDGNPLETSYFDVSVEIPSEGMIFGQNIHANQGWFNVYSDPWFLDRGGRNQLALFRKWGWFGNVADMWLRDVSTRFSWSMVFNNGVPWLWDGNTFRGVRPVFSIG